METQEHINLVFIGHVDAGKSSLCGQILYLSGMVDSRALEKCQKEAVEKGHNGCEATFFTDIDEEEREKNITIDVGRAYFATEKKRYTILDAPGHKMFVPNMINGVAQADVAILVIPARKGEYESGFEKNGQTKEHALLARTFGVKRVIVAINKMDDETVNWDLGRFEEIKNNAVKYLRGIGFLPKDINVVPVSAFTGLNVKDVVSKDVCSWYDGLSLLDMLDSLQSFDRLDEKPLRIPVLDKIKEEGKFLIMGKIESGILKVGDEIVCQPNNIKLKVNMIANNELSLEVAKPGENVKIYVKVSADDEDYISKGNMLTHPSNLCNVTSDIVVRMCVRELLENSLFCEGIQCVLHMGLVTEEVQITKLLDKLDNKGNSVKKLPKFLLSNSFGIVHITFPKPLCVEKYDDYERLGLFVLRSEGKTIAFGKVIGINAPQRVKKGKK